MVSSSQTRPPCSPIKTGAVAVTLRQVVTADLDTFFGHQQDQLALKMAAFTGKDPANRDEFDKHWDRIIADPEVEIRTILWGGVVGGHVASYPMFGEVEVTYWIDKELWGKGLATEGLRQFLEIVPKRPLGARAAKDNVGSLRVLEKCRFVVVGEDKGFANARGEETEEYVLQLT